MARCLTLVALTLLALSGCGGRNKPPVKIERISVFAAIDRDAGEAVMREFTKETGIEVDAIWDHESAKTVGLAKRVQLEGAKSACVWWSGESHYTSLLFAQGKLEAWDPKIEPKPISNGRDWAGFSGRYRVIVYKRGTWPKELPKPKTLADLTHPKLVRQVAIARPQFGTTATHMAVLSRSKEGLELMRKFKANDVQLMPSNSHAIRAVTKNLALACITDSDDYLAFKQQDEELELVIPDQPSQADPAAPAMGVMIVCCSAAIIKGANEKDAKLALKFINFLRSMRGENIMANSTMQTVPMLEGTEHPDVLPWPRDLKTMDYAYPTSVAQWEKEMASVKEIFGE